MFLREDLTPIHLYELDGVRLRMLIWFKDFLGEYPDAYYLHTWLDENHLA